MDLEINKGAIDTFKFYYICEQYAIKNKFGALNIFNGIVREENNITALSFDIYMPLLNIWFNNWQNKAKKNNIAIKMTHSYGDVKVNETSFMCAFLSKHRKDSITIYIEFIEDFKANAPIWKYDVINGEKKYALNRSKILKGAGLLV